MLRKQNKLSREQFTQLLKEKQKKTPTVCGLFCYKLQKKEGFAIAIVASKKVVKKAHDRNYLRRVLYTYIAPYTYLPFFGYLMVSKEGYKTFLSDKKKIKESIDEFFKLYP